MERREFLATGLCLTAAAFLHRSVRAGSKRIASATSSAAPIAVGRGQDYGAQLRRMVEALGGAALAARPGESVVVKPTLAWNRRPEEGANVHPDVLRAVLELTLEGGAERVTVFDRTSLAARTVYRLSGAERVVRSLGDPRVELIELRESDFVPLEIQMRTGSGAERRTPRAADLPSPEELDALERLGASLERLRVCRQLVSADRVVNVATARTHPTRRVSMGLGNLIGLVGGWPTGSSWGAKEQAELALLGAAVRPELTVLDATRAVVRNGPAGRGRRDVDRWDALAASRDPLAIDAHGARLFGLRPARLPYLGLAARLGLGAVATAGRTIEL